MVGSLVLARWKILQQSLHSICKLLYTLMPCCLVLGKMSRGEVEEDGKEEVDQGDRRRDRGAHLHNQFHGICREESFRAPSSKASNP